MRGENMGAHISIPMYQRSLPQRYHLVAKRCLGCGEVNFPPKGVCKHCLRGAVFEDVALSGLGTIYSFTVISGGGAPPEFSAEAACKGRYPVVLVELAEGPRIIGQMVPPYDEELRINTPVEMVTRRIYEEEGVIRYGFKFRVVNSR